MDNETSSFLIPFRQRAPCAGLFLAAVTGILVSDTRTGNWIGWSAGSLILIVLVIKIRSSLLAYLLIAFLFASWHDYQITTNPGYQRSRQQSLDLSEHTVTLVVLTEPKIDQYSSSQRFVALATCIDNHPVEFQVSAECSGEPFGYGDELIAQGRFSLPKSAMNPGEFDYRDYLARKNIYLDFRAVRGVPAEIVAHGKGNPLIAIAFSLRHRLADTLQEGLENDPEVAQTIQGMVLGGRSETSSDLKQLFQETGTIHLFAASGLQVGLFAGLAWRGIRYISLSRRWTTLGVVSLLIGYSAITGFYPATIRATVTTILLSIGFVMERPVAIINSLCASGLLILLHDTQELFLTGFQLSFAAVLAIVIAVRPLSHLLFQPLRPDPFLPRQLFRPWQRFNHQLAKRACEALGLCLVCWAATLPILAFHEHQISLVGVLANMIVVPLASTVMLLGVAAMIAGNVSGAITISLNNANWLITKVILCVLRAAVALPWHCVNVSPGAISQPDRITILCESSEFVLHVHEKSHDWLFNAGTLSQWVRVTEPYLKSQGINRIDKIMFRRDHPLRRETLEKAKRSFEVGQVVQATADMIPIELGSFRVLILPELSEEILEALPKEQANLVLCGRLMMRRMPRDTLVSKIGPDLIIWSGKRTGTTHDPTDPPCLYVRQQGAITAETSGESLWVHSFCGAAMRLPTRSR